MQQTLEEARDELKVLKKKNAALVKVGRRDQTFSVGYKFNLSVFIEKVNILFFSAGSPKAIATNDKVSKIKPLLLTL